jgi:hypothetical protein
MSKTVELGVIKKYEDDNGNLGDPSIVLDSSVKKVKLVMDIWNKELKAVEEKEVELVPTAKGKFYINIPTVQDNVEFLVENYGMNEEKATAKIDNADKYNISRILTAKVE